MLVQTHTQSKITRRCTTCLVSFVIQIMTQSRLVTHCRLVIGSDTKYNDTTYGDLNPCDTWLRGQRHADTYLCVSSVFARQTDARNRRNVKNGSKNTILCFLVDSGAHFWIRVPGCTTHCSADQAWSMRAGEGVIGFGLAGQRPVPAKHCNHRGRGP